MHLTEISDEVLNLTPGAAALCALDFANSTAYNDKAAAAMYAQVSDYLIETAMRKEQGEGPDPDHVLDDIKSMRGLHKNAGRISCNHPLKCSYFFCCT